MQLPVVYARLAARSEGQTEKSMEMRPMILQPLRVCQMLITDASRKERVTFGRYPKIELNRGWVYWASVNVP